MKQHSDRLVGAGAYLALCVLGMLATAAPASSAQPDKRPSELLTPRADAGGAIKLDHTSRAIIARELWHRLNRLDR